MDTVEEFPISEVLEQLCSASKETLMKAIRFLLMAAQQKSSTKIDIKDILPTEVDKTTERPLKKQRISTLTSEQVDEDQIMTEINQPESDPRPGTSTNLYRPHKMSKSQTNEWVVVNSKRQRQEIVLPEENKSSREKVPHITMREPHKWSIFRNALKSANITCQSASTPLGIKMIPSSIAEFDQICFIAKQGNIQIHHGMKQDEKQLHIVIRGLPITTDLQEVIQDLEIQGFHPEQLQYMKHPIHKHEMPLIMVKLPREEKEIFNVSGIIDIKVKVESLRKSSQITQCFRCQKFGHGSSRCTATPKCYKCGEDHFSENCASEGPFKCANCGDAHKSCWRGCKLAPKRRTFASVHQNSPPPLAIDTSIAAFPALNRKQPTSAANAVKSNNGNTKEQNFCQFQELYHAMLEITTRMTTLAKQYGL